MRIVVSGCSGAGKSTLLDELSHRGFETVEEPGRRVVRERLEQDGDALPWRDAAAFAVRCIELAVDDHARARPSREPVFFDRSLVDAWSALEVVDPTHARRFDETVRNVRYWPEAFVTPPWEALFSEDRERRHSFADAVAEFVSDPAVAPGDGAARPYRLEPTPMGRPVDGIDLDAANRVAGDLEDDALIARLYAGNPS